MRFKINSCKFLHVLLLLLAFTWESYGQSVKKCDSIIDAAEIASNKNQYTKALELYTQARIIAEKNDWHEQQFLAINGLGANYYLLL